MRNHKEMFEALLAGEILVDRHYSCYMKNGIVKLYINGEETDLEIWNGNVNLWQIKPKTTNINGFEVPEPVRKPLNRGDLYYFPGFEYFSLYSYSPWDGDTIDLYRLKSGVVHLSKENAIKHAEALLSFTRKTK